MREGTAMAICDQIRPLDSPAAMKACGAIRVALLGLGQVGSAVARLAAQSASAPGPTVDVIGALVRDPRRHRADEFALTTDPEKLLNDAPDVVVEVLGGTEPARQIVIAALERGIPVVTANKTLIATHGDELRAAAEAAGTALRYEAAVIAGVPFLGTLARRPFAGACRRIEAILNGTSNFVLSEIERGAADVASAVGDAQRLGYAEPNPAKDVSGADAAEKLAVLLAHFAGLRVCVGDIPTTGIEAITRLDLVQAREFGGTVKPVACADWAGERIDAFVGPAFVPAANPLAHLHGASNGIRIHSAHAPAVLFAGAGAGPEATATTILDDVVECATGSPDASPRGRATEPGHTCPPASAEWFVRFESPSALPGSEVADLLAGYGVFMRRWQNSDARSTPQWAWAITHRCSPDRLRSAIAAVSDATGCTGSAWPCLRGTDD
jgi:homoserine dehydrogenase